MKTSNLTLIECVEAVRALTLQPVVYIDQIPDVLQEDFNTFIIGHTISVDGDRRITYDIKQYYDKLMNRKGIDYPVQWKL